MRVEGIGATGLVEKSLVRGDLSSCFWECPSTRLPREERRVARPRAIPERPAEKTRGRDS